MAKQKSGGDDMRISPQESEKPKGTEVEDNKHGGEGKLRMDKYAQLGGDVRDLSTDSEGEEMADHTAGRAKKRTTSPQTKSGGGRGWKPDKIRHHGGRGGTRRDSTVSKYGVAVAATSNYDGEYDKNRVGVM